MSNIALQRKIQSFLHEADIKINGSRPWDIQVHDERLYNRVLGQGTLGLGEAYMDGWWEAPHLDEFIARAMKVDLQRIGQFSPNFLYSIMKAKMMNMQSKSRALIVGRKHYDLDNDLFEKMLDKRMTYSCAYWKNASNIDEAQEAKLELICQKLHLKPGMKILDIGCGWGSFSKYVAERYQANVVGITISKNQLELGRQLCKGLPVDLRFQDYREINEKFDRVVSVGQMEHVGYKNYKKYMKIVNRCLKDDGIFLLHTIGSDISGKTTDPWIDKYIFPNGLLPSHQQLSKSFEGEFVLEDWHNFGPYYDQTLLAWYDNFKNNWDTLKNRYDERFYRMWKYYLLTSAGGFRARKLQLWQIVLSKTGVIGGYQSIR